MSLVYQLKNPADDLKHHSTSIHLITDGHRAIRLAGRAKAQLYDTERFRAGVRTISPVFWTDTVLPSMLRSANETVSRRLTAAATRARHNASVYDTTVSGGAEIATEILFDNCLCKPHEVYLSRQALHHYLRMLRASRRPIRIGLPLFSRKPVSPLKNRGSHPDLAEIASLLRCYVLARMLAWVHDYGVEFVIFADGYKYRRACGTPYKTVAAYQDGLRYWCKKLGIDEMVRIVDYEQAVYEALGASGMQWREAQYTAKQRSLERNYNSMFSPYELADSLNTVGRFSPLGNQICFAYNSIVTSVYYDANKLGERLARHEDEAQNCYLDYVRSLLGDLRSSLAPESISLESGAGAAGRTLALELRQEAWYAALRYVAISLTDREIDIWNLLNPNGLKLTIHGKPGEVQFRPTSSEFLSMTAQHCVGGIKHSPKGARVTYTYRLERESQEEVPVLLSDPSLNKTPNAAIDAPVRALIEAHQPICYLAVNSDPHSTLRDYFLYD